MARATDRQTMPMKRGEHRSDSRSNAELSEQPIRSCAAFDSQVGIAERLTPPSVDATVTLSGASIQAFGMRNFASVPPAAAAMQSSAIRPTASTANCVGR
jgi:hypothetical protein